MDENKDLVFGLNDINVVVDLLKKKLVSTRVFAFYGTLGVGKTTIIRELLRSCGVQGPITSPTFTYVNCYKNSQGLKFYHFDLYRLNNLDDFLGAGFEEYLDDSEGVSFVEWPEIIESILPSGACKVKIDYNNSTNGEAYGVVGGPEVKRTFGIEIID